MNLYYSPDPIGEKVLLSNEESRHCTQVLRLVIGDILHLTDGRGNFYKATICEIKRREVQLTILEKLPQKQERDYRLHMAVAPTKNIDRFEWFLEKATEIGIDEITPLICEHSERRVIRPERLEKIIIAAMKQSLKAYKPHLNNLSSFSDFLKRDFSKQSILLAHCKEGQKELLRNLNLVKKDLCILIGPEGDFSADEIDIAKAAGAQSISLGDSRLRTETAALVACHSAFFLNH